MDGNSGDLMKVLLSDFSSRIPDELVQHHLIDTVFTPYSERESQALSDWNCGRGIIYMRGTSSTFYKAIHFFSKSHGWHVGKLSTNERYPLVIGASCGLGTYDMAQSPDYGIHFASELLVADDIRGTFCLIGPSRGTFIEGNRQMCEALNKYISMQPAQDIGSAFMLAQHEMFQGSQRMVAESYNLLGDPMAPLPGQSCITEIESDSPEHEFILLQNYPNPFNPITTIQYSLAKREFVSLKIFDITGRLVRTCVNEVKGPGKNQFVWDGRNNSGKQVASGVYFYFIKTSSKSISKKLVLLR